MDPNTINYFNNIINQNSTNSQQQGQSSTANTNNLEAAFNFANSCRDKEIDRFWSRGLYFWGFITASFAAYMAVFILALGQNENGAQNALCMQNILAMSFTSKLVLFVLAFICFIFCLSWQLVHKASKYWQESWEKHIKYLEDGYIGRIYDSWIILKEEAKCPFSVKAYNYSVSKISSLCSILLSFVSLGLVFFHVAIMLPIFFSISEKWLELIFAILLIVASLLFLFCFYRRNCKGNNSSKNEEVVFHKAEIQSCRQK